MTIKDTLRIRIWNTITQQRLLETEVIVLRTKGLTIHRHFLQTVAQIEHAKETTDRLLELYEKTNTTLNDIDAACSIGRRVDGKNPADAET